MNNNEKNSPISLTKEKNLNDPWLMIGNSSKQNDIEQCSALKSDYAPSTEPPNSSRNRGPVIIDKIIEETAEPSQSNTTTRSSFFKNYCTYIERTYSVINIVTVKSCIVLFIHYCYLVYNTGILANLYNYIGIALMSSLVFFPSQFIYFIKEGEKNKMIYCITVSIAIFLLTATNYAITWYPSLIGQDLYSYFLTLTNIAHIYYVLLILEGSGIILAIILSSIYSDEELAQLKVPLLE